MNPVQETTVLTANPPASNGAGNLDSTAIDYGAAYESEATVVLSAGVLGASATVLAKLQESSDLSVWTDVATTVTLVKATDDNKTAVATGRTTKRYVRVRTTTATAASISGAVILCKRRVLT